MRITYEKRMRNSAFLIMLMLLSGCGNSTDRANGSNVTTSTVEMTTEAVTEAPDTTSPVIELASDTVAYYIGDKYDPMDYVSSVTDDTDENIKAEYDDKNVNIASPGDYVINYSATDTAGNSSEKKLNLKVKKEYTMDEISVVIQELIDSGYYNFDIEDDHNINEDECYEGAYTGAYFVYGNFEDYISDLPAGGYWGNDPTVYTRVNFIIYVNDINYGVKNANKTTLNSELIVNVMNGTGDGIIHHAVSMDISSDSGRTSIDTTLEKGSYITNEPGYFGYGRTFLCFNSEDQIEKLKSILNSNNVSIKVHYEEGVDFCYMLDQTQRGDWLKVIRFYDDLNEYVNNIPVEE